MTNWHTIIIPSFTLLVYTSGAFGDSTSPIPPATPTVASEPHDLTSRYARLSCAIVRIMSNVTAGTGFFVDHQGTLATASHVVFDKTYVLPPQFKGQQHIPPNVPIINQITPKAGLRLQLPDGTIHPLNIVSLSPADSLISSYDLALLRTGLTPTCFIPVAVGNQTLSVGQHLISIGIPGSALGPVLYDGFLSSLSIHPPLPLGTVEEHPEIPVFANYWLLRVQMPITLGASGSPVISETNQAVGIISEEPVIGSSDVSAIEQRFGGGRTSVRGVRQQGLICRRLLES